MNPMILRIINKDFGGSLVAFHPSCISHINLGFIKLIRPVKKNMPIKIQEIMIKIWGIPNFNQLLNQIFIYRDMSRLRCNVTGYIGIDYIR